MPTELGRRIRRYRLDRGLTLKELARLADTSKTYIWQIENRPDTAPSLQKLEAIARSLEVSPDLLLRQENGTDADEDLDLTFLQRYRQLSPDERRKVRQLVDIIFDG